MDPAAPPLHIETTADGVVLVLSLIGVLDIDSAPLLRAEISQRPPDAALVIDLRQLSFIDTTGIQVLLAVHRASQGPPPWRYALIPGASTQRIFDTTGLRSVLRWVDHPDDVL